MTDPGAPRIADYLGHILQAIRRIYRYTEEMDGIGFMEDERTQDAVIRNFEIIGEAARNIEHRYPDYSAQHPNVPWAVAYEMRNVLAHGYFKIDLEVVWKTIETDLPELEKQIMTLQADLAEK